ncbi:MAG TPA: hypothetical protein VGQ83_39815, partial [Polyangia bacterium]
MAVDRPGLDAQRREGREFQTSMDVVENHRTGGGEENFAAMFEESLKHEDVKEGDIVKGTVISVGKDFVVVDIGYKSEG